MLSDVEVAKVRADKLSGSFTRRDFFRVSAATSVAVAIGGASRLWAADSVADDPARLVARVRGTDVDKMVRKALDLFGGMGRFVQPGYRVVLKPNASFANEASWGNNTNPAVVNTVAKLCREAGARRVTVLDYPLYRGAQALELNGVAQACKNLNGVDLSVLSKRGEFRKVHIPNAQVLKEVEIARSALDADLIINLPVAKAHDAVAASIGLKNLMGVIWDRAVFHTSMDINKAIADLSLAIRPQLTIVDLTRVMVTNGPKGPGEVVEPEMILVGTDPVALDALALRQVRFNGRKYRPKQLKYLRYAHKAGLGRIDLGELNIREVGV